MEIKIYTSLDDTGMYNEEFRYKGTYLHGKLEIDMGYDIFCFDRKLDIKEGIHSFIINSIPSTLFLWKGDINLGSVWRGYLIYNNDEEFEWCKENFNNKKQFI